MQKKVLIVGAGWLGKPLAIALKGQGHDVQVTATTEEKCGLLKGEGLEAFSLKLDGHAIQLPFADVLVVTIPPRGGQEQSEQVMNLLRQAAIEAGIKKLVYCSSTAVYPDLNREVTVDDAADFPSAHSGVRLLKLEGIFTQEPQLSVAVMRLGGLFGPGRHPSRFVRNPMRGPEQPVNMAHLDDCISAISEVIHLDEFPTIRNVVQAAKATRRDFYNRACLEAGQPLPEWTEGEIPWKSVRNGAN